MPGRRRIALNDLARWSPWPRRLLRMETLAQHHRTIEEIDREYDREKYAACLKHHEEDPSRTADDIRAFETGGSADEICVSVEGELYAYRREDVQATLAATIAAELSRGRDDIGTVVELGAGYGYNLWQLAKSFPRGRFLGADYSQNAVLLSERLFRSRADIVIRRFDLYDERYELLEELDGPALVFTVYAIQQLPSARPAVDAILRSGANVSEVIHFEPVLELEDPSSLLGLLRIRYAEVNDYDRDVLSVLRARPDVEIRDVRHDVLGVNPLTPLSILRWRPRR